MLIKKKKKIGVNQVNSSNQRYRSEEWDNHIEKKMQQIMKPSKSNIKWWN
jgi:hypothetical protein